MYFIRILWPYAPPTPPHTPAANIKAIRTIPYCQCRALRTIVSQYHGHISKTRQDRPIVMEHYWHCDSVAAFRSFPDAPPWADFLVLNTKKCSTWRQTPTVMNRADRPLTADVVSCYKRNATLGIC